MMEMINELKIVGLFIASALLTGILFFYIKLLIIGKDIYKISQSLEEISKTLKDLSEKFENKKEGSND